MVTSDRHVDQDTSIETHDHRPRVWTLSPHGARQHRTEEIPELLTREEGFLWVDMPICGPDGTRILSEVFKFAPRAVRDATARNAIPKVREHPGFLFVVLHAPERGLLGHVHYLELDLFIGPNYLVTVHGPTNSRVDPRAVVASVTLPVTALSGVLGMNVIVSERTEWPALWVLIAVMVTVSAAILYWTRRQGWW
jgi:Mg2+ and Co2+ transporter CorA